MNTRAIALTALGVGVAVAGAMVALQQKVEPIAEALVVERARARAQATSLSVERAFLRSRRALETVARALSESPAFEELGGGVPDQLRDAEMVGALKDATLQLEGQVRAVLLDGNGAPVVGAAPLAETDAARDAGATGAAVYRLERDERRTREVIAVPLAGGDGAGRPRGLVVLARPMEPIRLAGWAGPSAAQPMFGLFEGGEPLVSLMPPDLSGAVRSTRGQAELQLGEDRRFAVSELDVTPAVGRPVRLVALSALRGPADADVMSNVRGVVVGLGLLAFVIVAAILFLLPDPAPAPAVVAGEARVGPRTHDLVASPSSPLEGRPGDSLAWPRGERSGGHGEGAGGAAPAVGAPSTLPTPEAPEPAQTLRPPPRAASFLSKAAGPIPGTPPPPSPVGFAPSAHAGPPPAAPLVSGLDAPVQPAPPPASSSAPSPMAPPPSAPPPSAPPKSAPGRREGGAAARAASIRPDPLGAYGGALSSAEHVPQPKFPVDATPHSSATAPPRPAERSVPEDLVAPKPSRAGGGRSLGADLLAPDPAAGQRAAPPLPGGDRGERGSPPPEAVPARPARGARPPEPTTEPGAKSPPKPSFDRIAGQARPSGGQVSKGPRTSENLPVPKGGLSPGMIAGQGLEKQGRGSEMVPPPIPRFEEDLPIGKEHSSHLYDLGDGATSRAAGGDGASGDATASASGAEDPEGSGARESVEPFDQRHYDAVFDDFVAAKREVGESTEGLDRGSFGRKLRDSEEKLIRGYECRAVRFKVLVNEGKVSLRPELIRSPLAD